MVALELREVAERAGLPVSKAKNWVVGRPLRIKASVREAKGKGTRNLYSERDVFAFALAVALMDEGVEPEGVQVAVDIVQKESSDVGKRGADLVLWREGKKWAVEFKQRKEMNAAYIEKFWELMGAKRLQILHLDAIEKSVEQRRAKRRGKRKRD